MATDIARKIQSEIGALQGMTTGELAERYAELHGHACRTRHRAYLIRKIAWRIQANAEGDLSERARRRAVELANDADVRAMAPRAMVCPPQAGGSVSVTRGAPNGQTRDPRLPAPGSAIVRQYKGRTLRVVVLEDKEWKPAEKAQFISQLIDEDKLSYDEVRKRIGSKLPAVRQHYISYRLLLQMEGHSENIDVSKVEQRFSVLYLSLRTDGVRKYLHIKIDADPKTAKKPVPTAHLKQLENFVLWLFGDSKHGPRLTDSRRVDDFGKMLSSTKAVAYLERTDKPSFEVAKRMAGVRVRGSRAHRDRSR